MRTRTSSLTGLIGWLVLSLAVIATAVLSPNLFKLPEEPLRLGPDLPLGVLEDPAAALTADEVASLPDASFTWQHEALNKGYSDSVYWLRIRPFPNPQASDDPWWLEIRPSHLDEVILYERGVSGWIARATGNAVPMSQRVHTPHLVLPVSGEQPVLLRVRSSRTIQLYGRIWRNSGLLAQLSRTEWASGVHLGICLLLALVSGGAALALRTRLLTASAILALAVLVHTVNTRRYPLLWLPEDWAGGFDTIVRLGIFLLPAALAWQGREFFTRGTAWRRLDRIMVAHTALLLLATLSVPAGRYSQWSWFSFFSPWFTAVLCAVVAWTNMYRRGMTPVRLLMAVPYTLHSLLGLQMGAAYMGMTHSRVQPDVLWQAETLLLEVMIMVAVGANLIARFQNAQRRQSELVDKLARSEQVLDERVRQRTAELQQAQLSLEETLASEREMRHEQRQFFSMINHEFRTPLAIMDSAAAEQFAFPSSEPDEQRERAAQIRRACRRLSILVDNCLVGDRINTSALQPQMETVSLETLMSSASQLAQWSRRHHVRLDLAAAPAAWRCDAMLVHIALSNLVDNAVKHAAPGEIVLAAKMDTDGRLHISVTDEGPGFQPELAQQLFEDGQRGKDTRAPGFGMGLWVARRIAQLHGGDVDLAHSASGGSCFTLILGPPSPLQDSPAQQSAGQDSAGLRARSDPKRAGVKSPGHR